MKKKIVYTIIIVIIIVIGYYYIWNWIDQNARVSIDNTEENSDGYFLEDNSIKEASDLDKFYLEDGKLFVLNSKNEPIQVPGDFSEMTKDDYIGQNHQANTNYGDVYFYYELDNKIFLVKSDNLSSNDWDVKELTNETIGMPSGSKIKALRVSGSFGFIFYIEPNGTGKILKSKTKGDYWYELKTEAELNDNCSMVFLNEYGLTTDTFLRVPSNDGEKCDLYKLNISGPTEVEKMEVAKNYDESLDYYMMPYYLNSSSYNITIEVGKNSKDTNPVKFMTPNWGLEWITEEEYNKRLQDSEQAYIDSVNNYNKSVDNLDDSIFLINFNSYNVTSNEIEISRERAEEIADIGFAESASRIASEGITDTQQETVEIQEVCPNNYFTRKYDQGDKIYNNIKRKAYVFSKYNSMGFGVSIYVDVTTGLILGARAYSD